MDIAIEEQDSVLVIGRVRNKRSRATLTQCLTCSGYFPRGTYYRHSCSTAVVQPQLDGVSGELLGTQESPDLEELQELPLVSRESVEPPFGASEVLWLSSWVRDYNIPTEGAEALLSKLRSLSFAQLGYIQSPLFPGSVRALHRHSSRFLTEPPDICISRSCEGIIRINGAILQIHLQPGWFALGRADQVKMMRRISMATLLNAQFDGFWRTCKCSGSLPMEHFVESKIWCLLRSVKSFAKELYANPVATAYLLWPYFPMFPEELQIALSDVVTTHCDTRAQFCTEHPDLAVKVAFLLQNEQQNAQMRYEQAKVYYRNTKEIRSECWHGNRYWADPSLASSLYCLRESFAFDWFGCFRKRSVAPLLCIASNVPRMEISHRADFYMTNLGYVPSDHELGTIELQPILGFGNNLKFRQRLP
jgi:hypothetical protein